MDEADLLKERLQAITDKRKLQEDIAKKKLEIEEEKLKLQYLKKKSLREQWLMDGLSPQSEQEQEAMKLQVLNEQEQAGVLQKNIHRIEKEIAALESRELTISENEMLILQRLKEVEKTAADIIKEVNADIQPAIPDIPKSFKPSKQLKKMSSPKLDPDPEESKQALFVMEINVQKDMRTGKSQVLSTATVTTEDLPKKGIKVYDDGRKSVYALPSDAQRVQNGVGELTPQEVEELLRKATEKSLEADVEYHDPVFSSPYSRPSTPKRQNLDQLSPRPAPRRESFKNVISSQNIQNSEVTLLQGQKKQELSHIPLHWSKRKVQQPTEHSKDIQNNIPISSQAPLDFEMHFDGNRWSPALSIEGDRAALPLDSSLTQQDPFPEISKLNILNTMPENIDSSKPVSMIFMGYQNADNDEEGEVIQAELVVISDDDNSPDMQLSYHPDGCSSKVFQPKMNRSSKAKQYLADTRSTLNRNYVLPDATVQVQGQQSGLSQAQQSFEQMVDDGTKDPSAAALRMRMARLGKKKSTAREKQTNGNELREGSSDTQNQKEKEQKYFPQEVTMETSQLSEMATVRDHKMDSGETEVAENKGLSEEAETAWSSADSSESRMKENVDILTDLPQWTADNKEQHSLENGKETDNMCQKEALILETEHNYLNRTESMTSSVSDTTSSAGTVCENEMLHKTQEQSDQERSDTPVLPTTEDTEESETTRTPEPVIQEVAMDSLSDNRIQVSIIEDCIGEEASSGISTYLDPGDADLNCILRVEIEPVSSDSETDERWRAIFSSSINREDDDSYMDEILNLSAQELFVQKVERNVENIVEINQSDDKDFPDHEDSLDQYEHHTPDCNDALDQYEHHALDCEDALEQYDNITPDHEDAPEQYDNITPDTEDVLDHYDDLIPDHDDALDQYEHPSPDDEDALDQYDNLIPDHEDTLDQYEHHNPDRENALDQYEHHITDLEDSLDQFEHHIQDREDILDQYEHHDDYEFETQEHPNITPSLFHGLSKISEDEEEFSHGLKCNTNDSESSKVNTNKKVPPDYCVIQETKSENVSTEHVDFRVARKQWLKMEEETKYQIYQPTFRQSTCQGGHNSMYTPVRNINRPKKEPELDCTALNDYSQTHLSPCSEDSGLDDSSYRSPCDDETPIEREIRLALEREESLRRERGISKAYNANECTQATGKPVILQPGKIDRRLNQEIEERRKMFEAKEDNCRFPKSPSIKTPSFIITSSPSKGQLCQEVSGNSVIILEPEQYSSSPTRCKKDTNPLAKRANEWPSDVSNVVILEAPAMITRSSSEFCLNSVCQDTQDSTFLNNPFFKLRSRSTQSLIDDEIKMVKQREEELKKQRESIYAKDKYSTTLMSPNALDSLVYNKSELPVKCKSSPSSPMKSACKVDHSCENKVNHLCS